MIRRRAGFSLLELSVVLVILGVLLAAGINMGGNALKAADHAVTQERLATIKQALENYAARNNALPCPGDRALTPRGNPGAFGVSITNSSGGCDIGYQGAGLLSGCSSACLFIGGVPTRDLGLPDYYMADAWGNKFTYATGHEVATHFANAPVDLARPIQVMISGAMQMAASYIVVSHGPNGSGAYPYESSTRLDCNMTSGVERQNCNEEEEDQAPLFADYPYNDGRAGSYEYFDDYVVWGSNRLDVPPLDTAQPGCPSGTCETWCAACSSNMPVAPGMLSGTKLCGKIITNPTTCQAACLWEGVLNTGNESGSMVRCP